LYQTAKRLYDTSYLSGTDMVMDWVDRWVGWVGLGPEFFYLEWVNWIGLGGSISVKYDSLLKSTALVNISCNHEYTTDHFYI